MSNKSLHVVHMSLMTYTETKFHLGIFELLNGGQNQSTWVFQKENKD